MATRRGAKVRRAETLDEWQAPEKRGQYVTRGELLQWIALTRHLPLYKRVYRALKRKLGRRGV